MCLSCLRIYTTLSWIEENKVQSKILHEGLSVGQVLRQVLKALRLALKAFRLALKALWSTLS